MKLLMMIGLVTKQSRRSRILFRQNSPKQYGYLSNKTANISGNSIASKKLDNNETMVAGTVIVLQGIQLYTSSLQRRWCKRDSAGVLNYYCRSNEAGQMAEFS